MSNKLICSLIRCAVIVMALCGLLICGFWYPFSISLTAVGIVGTVTSQAQLVELWAQLLFYLFTSVPIFVILILFWTISTLIRDDRAVTLETAKRLKACAMILGIDLTVFFMGNLVFCFLGWNSFALIYFFAAAVGVFVTIVIAILAQYTRKAATLREENESYI